MEENFLEFYSELISFIKNVYNRDFIKYIVLFFPAIMRKIFSFVG